MSEMTVKEKAQSFWTGAKVKIVGLTATGLTLIASASAVDLNGTIGPILDDVILLIPTLIDLIVNFLPAIIVISILGFIVGFLDKILGMLKV